MGAHNKKHLKCLHDKIAFAFLWHVKWKQFETRTKQIRSDKVCVYVCMRAQGSTSHFEITEFFSTYFGDEFFFKLKTNTIITQKKKTKCDLFWVMILINETGLRGKTEQQRLIKSTTTTQIGCKVWKQDETPRLKNFISATHIELFWQWIFSCWCIQNKKEKLHKKQYLVRFYCCCCCFGFSRFSGARR